MRVADFFCGGGGFSEGFRQAGFEITFAVDKWKPAVDTYKGNKPNVNVIKDDVIRIANLDDKEFEELVPDTEVIIGSPPCQAFSQSNKSGGGDKALGIKLIEAYLKIIARKKFKEGSVLQYWILENVPNSQEYIKEEYTPEDFELEGNWVLNTRGENSGIYNAKYFGAPTNRKRFLCGHFPKPIQTHTDSNVVTLGDVIRSLDVNNHNREGFAEGIIIDINYPELRLPAEQVTDSYYVHQLAPFEWETALRLKQDKGYMGKMAFPENLNKPSRTVMATMAASSREAMILAYGEDGYRLPTVREVASMMSFPIDYWFYGNTKGIKHTLVGNAVPPKLSYAVAKAIAYDAGETIPDHYIPIEHNQEQQLYNLNGVVIPMNEERPKRDVAKFKYHIPYLIINAYRVELTNYHSDFENKEFKWDVEVHYSQGASRANKYEFEVPENFVERVYLEKIQKYLETLKPRICSYNAFQERFCRTNEDRQQRNEIGPYELLRDVREFLDSNVSCEEKKQTVVLEEGSIEIPTKILVGYYILQQIVKEMRGIS